MMSVLYNITNHNYNLFSLKHVKSKMNCVKNPQVLFALRIIADKAIYFAHKVVYFAHKVPSFGPLYRELKL